MNENEEKGLYYFSINLKEKNKKDGVVAWKGCKSQERLFVQNCTNKAGQPQIFRGLESQGCFLVHTTYLSFGCSEIQANVASAFSKVSSCWVTGKDRDLAINCLSGNALFYFCL